MFLKWVFKSKLIQIQKDISEGHEYWEVWGTDINKA